MYKHNFFVDCFYLYYCSSAYVNLMCKFIDIKFKINAYGSNFSNQPYLCLSYRSSYSFVFTVYC